MPEISEVLITANFLNFTSKNYKITKINILGGRYKKHLNSLKGYDIIQKELPVKIKKINTKGKFLWFELSNKNKNKIYLLNTFGMGGSWGFSKEKHSNLEFIIKKGSNIKKLYFIDPRNFGTICFGNIDILNKKLNNLGSDFLREKLDHNILKKRIANYLKISNKF